MYDYKYLHIARLNENFMSETVITQSSPMRESVNKSIQGAANLLRLLRYKDVNFDQLTVFALPKCGVQRCAVKITVTWKDMHFNYELKLLTAVDDLWSEIKCDVESQSKCSKPTQRRKYQP